MPANSPQIYWLFGLPAAGRTQLAQALQAHIQAAGHRVILLDGDELRAGLCEDLGFTEADQMEKVRRGAHMAKSHASGGAFVVCSFLTPQESHRELIRQILGKSVCLVYVQCALKDCPVCHKTKPHRSPKGAGGPTDSANDFLRPLEADSMIYTHDRPLTKSIIALCKLSAKALGAREKPGGDSKGKDAFLAGSLSARENEVLALFSQGLRQKEVAERLGISDTTVRTHLERACVKLSASSRTEAVARFAALRSQTL